MAKTLANYDPLVQIPSGMTPAGADFPIVESHDILVGENDKRLDAKLDDIDSAIGNVGATPIATQLSSKVNTSDIQTTVRDASSASDSKIPSEKAVRSAIDSKTITIDSTVTQGSTNAVSGGAVHTQLATKQDALTFDTTPTASSSNPVTSGGVKAALDTKQDALTFDTTPTVSSSNPVTSGGVKAALDNKQNTLTYETTPIAGSVNPVTSTGIRNAIDTAAAQNLGAMQAQYTEFVADADAVLGRASSLSNGMVACSNIAAETTVGDTRILLYTGTTNSKYTNGHWYYNSAASNAAPSWTDGGAVGSAPTIDNTLTVEGAAANSKAVGDAIENIVTISNTQPGSNSGNKVWIKETTSEEVQIPTYEEHIAKANKADIATNNESDNGSGTISASKAYAIGDHFYINNTNTSSENYGVSTLYKATAAIASGDAIVVGTNCEASKVADEITSLSNDIDTVKADLADNVNDLKSTINVIDNDIYELTNVPIEGAVWSNAQHTRIGLKLDILSETLLRVISAPSTIKVSVTAWTSKSYVTKVFDSGWLTTYPYNTVIDNTLYYMILFAKSDFSEFTSLTDIDDIVIVKLQPRIELMDATLTSLSDSVDNVNGILYKQPLIDLSSLYFSDANKKNINIKLGRFYDGGELIVENLPENVQIGINGFSGKNYVTRVTQSGWQKNTPFKLTINKDLYYLIAFAKYGFSAFDSLDEVASARLNVVLSVKPKIDNATPLSSLTVRSIAHRGDITIAPQNTAPSYILARKEGHTIGENDVWISADGEYVMEHDTSLSRLGNLVDINGYEMYTDGSTFYYYDTDNSQLYTYTTDYVASGVDVATLTRCNGADYAVTGLTIAVLKRIDFGVYMGSQFKGTQILTFAEWILLMKRLGMDAYIDRKLGYTTAIVTELVNIVKKYGMLDHVSWVGVPTTDIIEAIRAVDSNARIGVLEHPNDTNIALYEPYNTGRGFFFNGDAKNGLTEESVQKGINAGFEVETYYVGYDYPTASEADIYAMINNAIAYGVTGISLDHYRVDDAVKPLLDEYYIV